MKLLRLIVRKLDPIGRDCVLETVGAESRSEATVEFCARNLERERVTTNILEAGE